MKYEGKRKSAKDNQTNVYIFSFGIQELILFKAMVQSARKYTPRTFENSMSLGRLRNFEKVLGDFGKKEKINF